MKDQFKGIEDNKGQRLVFTDRARKRLYSLDPADLMRSRIFSNSQSSLVAKPTELDFVHDNIGSGWRDPVVLSCKKLLMCRSDSGFHLINPVTKEWKKVPDSPLTDMAFSWELYGFGFDDSTDQYKVVQGKGSTKGFVFSVYASSTNSWRKIEHLFPYQKTRIGKNDGMLLNGVVHWLVKRNGSLVIIAFDLAAEEVREIQVAEDCNNGLVNFDFDLCLFRDQLCITLLDFDPEGPYSLLWVMKKYGAKDSWTMMPVPAYTRLRHSGFWTEDYDFMLVDEERLAVCNFKDKSIWTASLRHFGEIEAFGSMCTVYVDSLKPDQEQPKKRALKPLEEIEFKAIEDNKGHRIVFLDSLSERLYSLDPGHLALDEHKKLIATATELDFVPCNIGSGWVPIVLSSCKNLLMCKSASGFHLINPVTKEWKKVPKSPQVKMELYGFGFDDSTDQYKVVEGKCCSEGIVFYVYASSTDCWRKKLSPWGMGRQPRKDTDKYERVEGTVLNGVVHWLFKLKNTMRIITFDLALEEVTKEIQVPPSIRNCIEDYELSVFRDQLCLTAISTRKEVTYTEFWVMKKYGVTDFWTEMEAPIQYRRLVHSGFWTEDYDILLINCTLLFVCNYNDECFWAAPIYGEFGEIELFGGMRTVYVDSLQPDQEEQVKSIDGALPPPSELKPKMPEIKEKNMPEIQIE